jgi:hypothetical protein
MIKRFLLTSRGDLAAEELASAWRDALGASAQAPPGGPVRAAMCLSLPEVVPNPSHDVVGIQWFADVDQLRRYEEWYPTTEAFAILRGTVDLHQTRTVVAEDHVLRGADWLEQRWRGRQPKFKHMALARRANGLTLAQFLDRWQGRAGKVGTAVIPDEARGLAYVQNHPLRSRDDWAYDAINEVYFDELDGLRTRIAYFENTLGGQSEEDLVSENWFLAVREEVLADRTSGGR